MIALFLLHRCGRPTAAQAQARGYDLKVRFKCDGKALAAADMIDNELSVAGPADASANGSASSSSSSSSSSAPTTTESGVALPALLPTFTRNAMQRVGATLIVSPMSIVFQWKREIAKHAPSLKVLVYDGKRRAKVLSLNDGLVDAQI
jgi:hypothetical protein